MNKKVKILIAVILVIILCLMSFYIISDNTELKTIKSEKQLYKMCNDNENELKEIFLVLSGGPLLFPVIATTSSIEQSLSTKLERKCRRRLYI